jgi:biopolymer transport protein ExbD
MAMSVGGSGEGQSYSEINMTPLIDVMLVLLIIFIITLPNQTHAVKIDNPLPPPPNFVPPPPPEVIDLTIDFDGTLLWNKTPVDRKTLQGYIETEAQKDPQPEVCPPKPARRNPSPSR